MNEDFFHNELIDRFEQMLENKENYYFDTEEFSEIIAYYLDIGDLPFAYKALEYAMQLHPESVETKIKLLEYYLEVDMLHEAHELITELNEIAKSQLDYVICLAKYWSIKGHPNRAIKYYKKALKFGEEEDYIHNCLGGEFMLLKEIGKALFHYKTALEINLDDEFAFYSCIDCFDEIHRHQECIDFLEQYIDLRPYAEHAWFQLGLQHLALKNYHEAIFSFDYAIVINPQSLTAYMQKAYAYECIEEYAQAIEVYREIVDLEDSAAFTYLKIGKCYLNLNEHMKALKAFHQSIHEDPQLHKSWHYAATLYEKLGNYPEAVHYLKRAIELDQTNISYWKRLAFLHIQMAQYEESHLVYQKIIKLEPGHFYNWFGYSELLIMLGDYQRAVEVLDNALQRFQRAELYYQKSCCLFLLQKDQDASEALVKAHQLNPKLLGDMLKKYPVLEQKTHEKQILKKP